MKEQVGAQFPVDLKCGFCKKRVNRTSPRVFFQGKYVCGDCLYYVERGETPPTARE